DTTTVTISINHLETSLGEPIEVSVVVYVPIGGYLTYTSMTNSGVAPQTVGMVTDKSSLNIKWGLLRFFESSEVILSFTINPDNHKDFGYGVYNMVVPHTTYIKLNLRTMVPGIARFPDQDNGYLP
ncbi:unnamed protein product, partial [Meganyctiphanes norvegica]